MIMCNEELATKIRLFAFTCESKDVFSCEFGNEFREKVKRLLEDNELEMAREVRSKV